jgi:hypothetical protein
MKILKRYIVFPMILALVMAQVSCKKEFLEIEPKGFLIAKTTTDYELILNATYLSSIYTASIFLGDDIAAQKRFMAGVPPRIQRLFAYEDRVYQPDELPLEINADESYIRRLYVFNKIINEVMQSDGGTEQQKQALLAEAKVGRAICNLSFLNDFSKPYNAKTANVDLGVPLITEADVTQTSFVRSTVKECYDFVIKDLTEALPNLGPLVHRRKFSKISAEFYLTRAYLYMADFTAARTHIDAAFAELSKSNIPLALYDYNTVLDPNNTSTWFPDSGFGLSNKPLAANNTQIIYNISTNLWQFDFINTFVYTPLVATLYSSTDKRIKLYANTEVFASFQFPKGTRRFPGFAMDIGPALPDMYLMRAELSARENNLAEAKTDLEALRTKRMSASEAVIPASIASNQQALVRFILDERTREFVLTGLRWLDMRRLSVDPLYKDHIKLTHEIIDDNGNAVTSYALRPERFALKFGERMLAESHGLQENP